VLRCSGINQGSKLLQNCLSMLSHGLALLFEKLVFLYHRAGVTTNVRPPAKDSFPGCLDV
jgi:hypothetical protein